jgi:hypothetical protein
VESGGRPHEPGRLWGTNSQQANRARACVVRVDSGAERKGGFRTLPTHVELRLSSSRTRLRLSPTGRCVAFVASEKYVRCIAKEEEKVREAFFFFFSSRSVPGRGTSDLRGHGLTPSHQLVGATRRLLLRGTFLRSWSCLHFRAVNKRVWRCSFRS